MQDSDPKSADGTDVAQQGRPTLKTIAFMTGLGVTTVSRALKDAPDIGSDTKRRVRLVAQQIGYRPNRAGVRLRTGKTNVISLVLDTDEQLMGFVSDIISGISERLAETPYHLVVTPYSRHGDPMAPIRYVVETGSADGIIFSRTEPNDPRVRYLSERRFPFVCHGRTETGIDHPFHDFDNRAFARIAVEGLAALGRRRLSLLPPPPSLTYHHHTVQGFAEGIAAAGLSEVPFPAGNIDLSIDRIRDEVMGLLMRPQRPDGIVSSSGAATLAVVAGIEDAGLVLGRDIDVVSKQSARILHLFRPQLHVVNESFRYAGNELARIVMARIDGREGGETRTLHVPEIVESAGR